MIKRPYNKITQKWFYLIYLFVETTELPPLRQIGDEIEVTKDTAMRMINKIKSSYVSNKFIIDTIVNTLEK